MNLRSAPTASAAAAELVRFIIAFEMFDTSNLTAGDVVPMPTLPSWSMYIRVAGDARFCVLKARAMAFPPPILTPAIWAERTPGTWLFVVRSKTISSLEAPFGLVRAWPGTAVDIRWAAVAFDLPNIRGSFWAAAIIAFWPPFLMTAIWAWFWLPKPQRLFSKLKKPLPATSNLTAGAVEPMPTLPV